MVPNSASAARAVARAVADGADIIETDLHFSKDNQLVLIHDATLERTVAAAGNVRDFTLAELQQFALKQPPERAGQVERIWQAVIAGAPLPQELPLPR